LLLQVEAPARTAFAFAGFNHLERVREGEKEKRRVSTTEA
jgi:hypothetical protein